MAATKCKVWDKEHNTKKVQPQQLYSFPYKPYGGITFIKDCFSKW